MMKNIFQKMKRSAAIFVIAGTAMAACNKLDQLPTSKFTDTDYWTNAERADYMLNMAYNQMYNAGKIWDDEALSDNMAKARGGADEQTIRRGQATPSTGRFGSEWKWCFEGIKTCNVFTEKIDLVPDMEPARKAEMVAQARFIRAFLYFRLSNFYGDIPFFLNDIDVPAAKAMTRTKRTDVLTELHRELDEIIPVLPKKEDLAAAQRGRITKAAAVMLKARICLMQKNYAGAVAQCDKLINQQAEYGRYALFNTPTEVSAAGLGLPNDKIKFSAYDNLFRQEFEYNSEVILDYAAVPSVKRWGDYIDMSPHCVPNVRVTSRVPVQSLVDDYIMLNGKTIDAAGSGYDPAFTEWYKNRDPRLDATIAYHGSKWIDRDNDGRWIAPVINIESGEDKFGGENNTQSGYYARKLFDPIHEADMQMANNIIMMRYADVLLMYAEAKEQQGQFDEAVWNLTIKPIRERAGFTENGALNFSEQNSADFRSIIRRERRCELALEGLRYFDLIRWDGADAASVRLNGAVKGVNLGSGNVTVDEWKFTTGRDEWWSLPQHEMDQAPALKPNNPNY